MYVYNLLLVTKKSTLFFLSIYSYLRQKGKVLEKDLCKAQIAPLCFNYPAIFHFFIN